MQSSQLKSVLKLGVLRWNFVRTIAGNSATVNVTAETQTPVKSWKEIPGPPSWPIIGQMLEFLPGKPLSDMAMFNDILYKKYGPIVRLDAIFGRPVHIFLFDPEACATILRGENWMPRRVGLGSLEYYRKKYKKPKEQEHKITGLITDQDDNWRQFRSTVNPVMMQPKTVKLYSDVLEEVAGDMVKRMKRIRDKDNMIKENFDVEMNIWALESIGTVALGQRINCFDTNLSKDSPERRLIQCVHDFFEMANELDFKPNLWRYFPTKKFRKAMKIYTEQENLTRYFIHKAMKDLENNKKSDWEKGVLEKLLDMDEEVAIIMASDMLLAGVDTAANTMTAALYLLAKNKDKQEKLRDVINSGDENEANRHVKAHLKESMRIMPVVAGNMRQVTKDYDVLGYRIPKDMYVFFSHQAMSVFESQFPRPKEYIPERWLDKDHPLYAKAHPFAFSPFGFGVRMCIGRRIAELETQTFLKKVITSFNVDWVGPPPKVVPTSLNYIKGPFNFVFKDV